MRVFYFLSIGLLLAFTSACATRLDDADEKITDLQKRTAFLEQKGGVPIGSDRDLLDGQRVSDMRTQVAALRNELTVLTGKVESLEYENKNMNGLIRELQEKVDAANREAKNQARQVSQTPAAAEDALAGAPGDYNQALRVYQDGDFEKAEKLFNTFVAKYPRHDLTDNALFWLGEGYMAKKMPKSAITKFQDLIEKFPKSDMRCEAMKNQISCLKQLGMEKEAAAFVKVRSSECPGR